MLNDELESPIADRYSIQNNVLFIRFTLEIMTQASVRFCFNRLVAMSSAII